jgi:hypothetical protein
MFRRIAPQQAKHSEGYLVQIKDRYSIEYYDHAIIACVRAEFGAVTAVYPDTLEVHEHGSPCLGPSQDERARIMARINDGLVCLGVPYRNYTGRPE